MCIRSFYNEFFCRSLATVITSLASAIPVIGNHIVTWLWGGFFREAYYISDGIKKNSD